MNTSANSTANITNVPIIVHSIIFSVTGFMRATIPSSMHESTITFPSKSPTARSACPFLMLCSEKLNSGSVVPRPISIAPSIICGTPNDIAIVLALSTM